MPEFTAFLVAIGPLAVLITKAVDLVRSFDKLDTWWKGTWIILAMALGVGYCLASATNLVLLVGGVDPSVLSRLTGIWGQIATGLAIGASASFWHEPLSGWGSKSGAGLEPEPAPAAE